MFRNQYLITDRPSGLPELAGARRLQLAGWHVYAQPPLPAVVREEHPVAVLCLGVMVDPMAPLDGPDRLADRLLEAARGSLAAAREFVDGLTGRFVVAVHREGRTSIWGDACHLRPILYARLDGQTCIASSERLLLRHAGMQLDSSEDAVRFAHSPLFARNEHAWVGEGALDRRVHRLLPNHELHLESLERSRLGLQLPSGLAEGEVVAFAAARLRGAFEALAPGYQLVQPVTAGWDSRLLLAASLPQRERIRYYIFDRGDPGTGHDARVAELLARRLGLNFERIDPGPLRQEFVREYEAEHLQARVLPKLANIQYHWARPDRDRVVNVNGNGAEVARCYYGLGGDAFSWRRCSRLLGCDPDEPYVSAALRAWHADAAREAARSGVSLLDLLYWEQRMGNWGAAAPLETDIAIEEVSPFNNRALLLALLTVPAARRAAPDYPLFARLVAAMSAEAAAVPVNPHVAWAKRRIARSARLLWAVKTARQRVEVLRARR